MEREKYRRFVEERIGGIEPQATVSPSQSGLNARRLTA